jgi:hypothetical protein
LPSKIQELSVWIGELEAKFSKAACSLEDLKAEFHKNFPLTGGKKSVE